MNTILETLPVKERDTFKQVIALYDEKKYKKALKQIDKLLETNSNFPGQIIRVHRNASFAQSIPLRRKRQRRVSKNCQDRFLTRPC